ALVADDAHDVDTVGDLEGADDGFGIGHLRDDSRRHERAGIDAGEAGIEERLQMRAVRLGRYDVLEPLPGVTRALDETDGAHAWHGWIVAQSSASLDPAPPILSAVLRALELRDFAIVDDLAIELGAGLNVLTGETGAGKS